MKFKCCNSIARLVTINRYMEINKEMIGHQRVEFILQCPSCGNIFRKTVRASEFDKEDSL